MNPILAAADMVKTAANQKAPVGEIGSVDPIITMQTRIRSGMGLPAWSHLGHTELEHVPALVWPNAHRTYRRMLNDPQIQALLQAIWLPAQRYRFSLDPNGMDAGLAAKLADDLDLPIHGQDTVSPGRRRDAFNFRKHLSRALSGLVFGHGVFEIVGRIDEQGTWRLVDLAPRPTWTLDAWLVDNTGRLEAIEQQHVTPPIRLDAERLVIYTWQGEPGDPRGQSLLRALYGPWLLKDRLVRLDAVTHERNAMGIPVGFMAEGSSPAERDMMLELLSGLAAGEQTALVMPPGTDVRLRGVEGSTSRVLDSLKFHNEEMARALLGMVIQLGQTSSGSRALGGTFLDLLEMFHDVVAHWVADTLTEQAAEAWVTFNQGLDAPAARVVCEPEAAPPASMTPVAAPSVPALPPAAETRPAESADQPATSRAQARGSVSGRRQLAAAALPDRPLRRQPYPHEVAAATDFASLEREFTSVRDQVVGALADLRGTFTSAAVRHLQSMSHVDPATLPVSLGKALAAERKTMRLDGLAGLLVMAVRHGEQQITAEAAQQGVQHHPSPLDYEARSALEAGALADRVAQQVQDSTVGTTRVAAQPGVSGSDVAGRVLAALEKLSTAQLDQAASGAVSRAQLAGRASAIDQAPVQRVYASELLDSNTCGPCTAVDGSEYASVDEAQRDYPTGGYLGCEGMERCRGTLVAVFDTEQQAAT